MMRDLRVPAAAAALVFPAIAAGQAIPVVNFSFEDPPLQPAGFTTSDPPGWTSVPGSGNGTRGVFYPTVASWGFTASLGHQTLYTNGPSLEQALAATAQANQTYTLRVDVINRPGFNGNNYFVELYAGSTLLARDNNSLHPAPAMFLVSTLSYTVGPNDPVIGQPFKIRLGGANQSNFDNVRLNAGTGCYANCDGSTASPVLNVNDFICFQTKFAANDPYANCDGSTLAPILNVNDFVCFQQRFAGGC
jgi:hypothetical protein